MAWGLRSRWTTFVRVHSGLARAGRRLPVDADVLLCGFRVYGGLGSGLGSPRDEEVLLLAATGVGAGVGAGAGGDSSSSRSNGCISRETQGQGGGTYRGRSGVPSRGAACARGVARAAWWG